MDERGAGADSAVVLLSGGLDSLVAAHLATRAYRLRLAVTADYRQRAADAEMAAAAQQAAALGVEHQGVHLPWLGGISASALTDAGAALPRLGANELDDVAAAGATAAAVWVPNRNGVLLMVAAAYAEALGCDAVVMGINAEEGATFPDNTPQFADAAQRLLGYSSARPLSVVCPVAEMTKTQMVMAAREHGIPLTTLHSCYEAGPGHCWECESCLRLKRALEDGGAWPSVSPHLHRTGR
jgi:7-cyano-7-deazaguanine synthase